jgi:hypothetical protein
MAARLYYELHITCEAGEDFELFRRIANHLDWRASRFSEDDVDDYHGKWFMSARVHLMMAAHALLEITMQSLSAAGITVIRWKVEDTLFDSKHGDTIDMIARKGTTK